MLIGDIVTIDFENFPLHEYDSPSMNRVLRGDIKNIWRVELIFYETNIWLKHISYSSSLNFNDIVKVSKRYLITLNDLRNNKIDKILC